VEAKKILIGYDESPSSEAMLSDLRRAALPKELDCVVLTLSPAWISREDEREFLATPQERDVHSTAGNGAAASAGSTTVVEQGQRTSRGVAVLREAKAMVDGVARRIAGWFPHWHVTAEARPDGAVWGLLERAREWSADLLIVGTHERSAMGRLIHGSVCNALLVDAPCSVRIARAPWTTQSAGLRVIAALDGNRDADAAIRELASRTWPAGSAVHLVSAYSPVILPGSAYYGMTVTLDAFNDEDLRAVFEQIARARRLLEPTGVTVTQSVRLDDGVALILEEASRWGADAIFLGARGHRAFERILLGSVTASVARRAHCSVEVIRPWKYVEM
jgi:nucleotide-binding universal stress UspA family protein